MAKMNAIADVRREDYFFDRRVPFCKRRKDYAAKAVLLAIFKGIDYAERWREVNMPDELRYMPEALRKRLRELREARR